MPPVVNIRNLASGEVRALPEADALGVVASQPATWALETPEQAAEATRTAQVRRDYDTLGDKAAGSLAAVGRGASVGLSDVGARLLGVDAATLANQREAIGGWATPLEIAGAVAPALLTGGATAPESAALAGARGVLSRTPTAIISRLGAGIAQAEEGASLAARVGRGALGAGVEGGIQSAGAAASDLALSDDPLSMDRLAGAVRSTLYGGGANALLGGGLSTLEAGLVSSGRRLKAAKAAEEAAALNAPTGTITDDIAAIPDRAGVKMARDVEIQRLKDERAIQRAPFIADVAAFRAQTKVDEPWVAVATGGTKAEKVAARKLARGATASADEAERVAVAAEKQAAEAAAQDAKLSAASAALGVTPEPSPGLVASRKAAEEARAAATTAREAADDAAAKYELAASNTKIPRWMAERGKVYIEADKHIDRLLRNMEGLAEATTAGEAARRSLRSALQEQRQALVEIHERSAELAAMHATDTTGRRAAAMAKVPSTIEANLALQARIDALGAPFESPRLSALEAHDLNLGTPKPPATLGQKIRAAGVGAAVYGVAGAVLPGFAHFAAAPLAAAASAKALGETLGPAIAGARTASIARQTKALDAFLRGARITRRAAVPLASQVLASVRFAPPVPERRGDKPTRATTLTDHYDARAAEIGRVTAPGPDGRPRVTEAARTAIGQRLAPIAAVAPHVADRLESAAVRRLEYVALKMPRSTQIGMTRLRPNELAIRSWARTLAAADDPGGIEERLAEGTLTPEDAEVMRALYPDRLADFVRQVVERLPELRASLPYHRRVMLSILTGAPVDASLDPRILGAIQAQYAAEPDTEGGTQAPRPRPAFGSVKKPEATPAQQRAG